MTNDQTHPPSQFLTWLMTTLRVLGPTVTSVIIVSGLLWTLAKPFFETFIVDTVKKEQFVSAATLNFALNRIEVLEARLDSLEDRLEKQTKTSMENRDNIRILLYRAGGFDVLSSVPLDRVDSLSRP